MPQENNCPNKIPPDIYNASTSVTPNDTRFPISFDRITNNDVVVYREQPEGVYTQYVGGYTIEDSISEDGQVVGGEVVFNTAPGGVSIIIGRRTSLCEPLVNYVPGASIRASDPLVL